MTQTWRPGLRTYHRKCFSKSRFIYKYHRPTLHLSHLLEMLRVVLVMASSFYSLHRWQSLLAPKWAASSGGDCCGSTEERERPFSECSPQRLPLLCLQNSKGLRQTPGYSPAKMIWALSLWDREIAKEPFYF